MAEAKSQMEDAGEAAFYRKIYNDAQEALDKILGTEEEDGAGDGLVADIYLVAEQRDEARSELARVRTQVAAELRAYAEYLRANGLLAVAVDVVRHGADRVECRRCPEGICSAHIPLPSGTVGNPGPVQRHASPGCACGVNDAGQRYVDPICRGK